MNELWNKALNWARRNPAERSVYAAIVAQARQPWFYADAGVPDTVDGRFDMITLHVVLLLDRLTGGGEGAGRFAQAVYDEFFRDMDRSLREMGVGDLSVGKKIRKMAEVFHGRARAYDNALKADARECELEKAVTRNIFPDGPPTRADGQTGAGAMIAHYIRETKNMLADQPVPDIVNGVARFPDVPGQDVQR